MGSFPSTNRVDAHPTSAATGSATAHPHISHGGSVASVLSMGAASDATDGASLRSGLHRLKSRASFVRRHIKGRVLLIGLDGSGKTTLVQQLQRFGGDAKPAADEVDDAASNRSGASAGDPHASAPTPSPGDEPPREKWAAQRGVIVPEPTRSPSVTLYRIEGDRYVQLVDLPGRRALRGRWYSAMLSTMTGGEAFHAAGAPPGVSSADPGGPSTPGGSAVASSLPAAPNTTSTGYSHSALPIVGIVFVVDASDRLRFPLVAEELVRLQKVTETRPHLQRAPFFLVLNKVDRWSDPLVTPVLPGGFQVAPSLPPSPTMPWPNTGAHHRRLARAVRQELKHSFDHQLRMDQKRHPQTSSAKRAAPAQPASSKTKDALANENTALGTAASGGASAPSSQLLDAQAVRNKRTALQEANANRRVVMMTSIIECCSFDRDSVRAVHTWLKEEVHKLWAA
ncbi:hypothetical protein ATCC90586_000467 [Pythium insidiosum]|nr:hypothetical protein ATCC90586_000467 [Pythium insidiosum]